MKAKLTESEKAELLPQIKKVLAGNNPWKTDSLHFPAGALIDAILEIKGVSRKPSEENDTGFTTNGWQWDWRQRFTHNGKEYTLCGSGYYGGHSFNLSD